jgi:hypothetical protein
MYRCKSSQHNLSSAPNTLNFYITSCAHAICQICMQKANPSSLSASSLQCPTCQTIGPVVPLGGDMPADVERLMTPLFYHLEDFTKIVQASCFNPKKG